MPIGKRLKRELDKRGLSQGQLALLSGVSRSHISMIIEGKRDATVTVAVKLAKPLDVSLDYLAGIERPGLMGA